MTKNPSTGSLWRALNSILSALMEVAEGDAMVIAVVDGAAEKSLYSRLLCLSSNVQSECLNVHTTSAGSQELVPINTNK